MSFASSRFKAEEYANQPPRFRALMSGFIDNAAFPTLAADHVTFEIYDRQSRGYSWTPMRSRSSGREAPEGHEPEGLFARAASGLQSGTSLQPRGGK